MNEGETERYDVDILWQHDHAGVKGFSSLAVDSQGNSYACGVAPDEEHGVVAKYSPNGDLEWTDSTLPKPLDPGRYRSIAGQSDPGITAALPEGERYGAFMDIAVDLDGNVVVAGSFCRTEPLRIYIMVQKYRPDGTVVWTREYMRRVLNHAMGVAVDSDNDIYLVGQGGVGAALLQPGAITLKALAMKIDGARGRVLWTRTRKRGQYMWYHDAAVDDGMLVVSGYSFDGSGIHPVVCTFRGPGGFWTRCLVPPDSGRMIAGLARHPAGAFHAVGHIQAAETADVKPYLLCFSADLDIRWETEDDVNAFLYGTDVLPDGSIIAAGMHLSRDEYYAALYDAAGRKIQDLFLGPVNTSGVTFNDYLKGIAVDGQGDVVLAGAWNPGKVLKIRLTPAAGEDSSTLQVRREPPEGGMVAPAGGSYPAGSEVTLQARPREGYTFSRWSGDAAGSARTIQIQMDGDVSVTAHFSEERVSWLHRLLQWLLGRR